MRVWAGSTGFVPVGCALRLSRATTAGLQMRAVTEAVRQAVARGASLVVLPDTGLNTGNGNDLAGIDTLIDEGGPELKACAALADELDIVLVIGAQARSGTEQVNVAVVFGPDGRRLGEHRKTALSISEEKAGFRAGAGFTPITTPLGRLGLLISKDVYRDPMAWGAA
jgi:predicted amidohydrolase